MQIQYMFFQCQMLIIYTSASHLQQGKQCIQAHGGLLLQVPR